MSNLSSVLSELLFERDSVVVPGLGMFVKHYDGARVNVITNHFEKPSASLGFDAQQRGEDGILVNALAKSEGISEEAAQQTLKQFVADCFDQLKNGKEVTLEGLGQLAMDQQGTLTFTPDDKRNFNGDAFGLIDFNPKPVFDGKRADVKKTTVADFDDEQTYERHRKRSLWLTLLSFLLLIPIVLLLLHFLEIIHLDRMFKPQPVAQVVVYEPDSAVLAQMVCYYSVPTQEEPQEEIQEEPQVEIFEENQQVTPEENQGKTQEGSQEMIQQEEIKEEIKEEKQEEKQEVIEEIPEKPLVEPVKPFKINIIGGCFSQQENAEKMVDALREEGFGNAYVLVRGKMYYVSYGGFTTLEEANAELANVKANSNPKAWILNK